MNLNWLKNGDRRTDSCPSCGRQKALRNETCSECKQKRGFKFKKIPKEGIYHYCQYIDCPSRLTEHLLKSMIRYKKVSKQYLFCTNECRDNFIKGGE